MHWYSRGTVASAVIRRRRMSRSLAKTFRPRSNTVGRLCRINCRGWARPSCVWQLFVEPLAAGGAAAGLSGELFQLAGGGCDSCCFCYFCDGVAEAAGGEGEAVLVEEGFVVEGGVAAVDEVVIGEGPVGFVEAVE